MVKKVFQALDNPRQTEVSAIANRFMNFCNLTDG